VKQFFASLGDRINPIVVKEVRQAVNSRIVAGALLLFLFAQMIVMAFQLVVKDDSTSSVSQIDFRAGREIFGIVQGILVGTCIVVIPAFTGIRLASERSDVNVDLLFISTLSPRKIISGKCVAAALLAVLIFSACAPFMTFAYVLRGLDIATILLILLADFFAVLLGTVFTVFLASIPATRAFRIFLGLIALVGLAYLTGRTIMLGIGMLETDFWLDTARTEFWLGIAGAALLVLGAIGLFFVWSVALISPVSANRALPVRLYTLGLWLVWGMIFAVTSVYVNEGEPMMVWGVFSAIFFSLQLLISVSERDEWGPRITKRIPKRTIFRIPAFFFFSGAAGGILFAVFCGLLSVGLIYLFHWCYPSLHWRHWKDGPRISALILGYTYCYCMSGVLIRRFGRSRGLDPSITWLVTFILVGLGSVLPFFVGLALEDRMHRLMRDPDYKPLFLTSPIMAIDSDIDNDFQEVNITAIFLLAWGTIVTVLNLGWLASQMGKFRPPEPEYDDDEDSDEWPLTVVEEEK
jgi:hypothetical protein